MGFGYGFSIMAEALIRSALAFDCAEPWFSMLPARAVFPGFMPGPH
jgi:hypothetical protein